MSSSDPPEAPAERVGQVLLGKLEVVRRIGGGGMGDVYEVEHLITQHRRALKIVRAEYARQRRYVERLLREASVAGRLKTPYVVETLDAGRLEDESAYILMELLEGISLHDMIHGEGTLSQRRVASILCQLAEGIGVAHAAGIIHRDLKPENVFIAIDPETGAERVKILDFGVSKLVEPEEATRLTREGTVLGTPFYMAPEQASGHDIDGRTDIWAMGVIAYEALTGKLPFWGDTIGEVFIAIGAGHYVPITTRRPDVDPAFAAVIGRALAADPRERYLSAEAMRRDLLPFAASDPIARGKTLSEAPASPRVDRSPRPPGTATPTRTIEDGIAAGSVARRSSRPPPEREGVEREGVERGAVERGAVELAEPAEPELAERDAAVAGPEPLATSRSTPSGAPSAVMHLAMRSPRAPLVVGAIAIVAATIAVASWMSRGSGAVIPPVASAPPSEAVTEPEPVAEPETVTLTATETETATVIHADVAAVSDAGARRATPERRREAPPERTPAEVAGLEGNPYGTP